MSKAKAFLSIVETDMTIAKEILRQLGGNKFIVMTGAKNLAGGDNYLSFKIGKNKTSCNYVKIKLNGKDLYDVEFGRIRGHEYKVLKTYNDVYNDQLRDIFTEYTGLYTSLGTMKG
jgi:hypothetical protein